MGLIEGMAHPALAWLGLLAAVPLVIHLLNRRRHRPLAWGAMRLIELAHRRTRRRTQLESLLLLLLRMAGVALLAFAIARPFVEGAGPLGSLSAQRRNLVLLLDGSASTAQHLSASGSAHERIVARARELLGELSSARGDRARVFLCGASARLLSDRSPEAAQAALASLSGPLYERLDLASCLSELLARTDEASAAAEGAPEIRLLTDMQQSSLESARDPGAAGQGALERLHALGWKIEVEDLGPERARPANAAIEALSVDAQAARGASSVPIDITVANFADAPLPAARVALFVDGDRRGGAALAVPSQGRATLRLSASFASPGEHWVEARLEGDALAFDDRRVHIVPIGGALRIALVDGSPARADQASAGAYLQAALAPLEDDGAAHAQFAPRLVSPNELYSGALDLAQFDALWLAELPSLPGDCAERVQAWVAQGGALVISAGAGFDGPAWTQRLWRADGTGLLPAELGEELVCPDRRRSYFRIASFDETHPALSFFADDRWRPLLTELPIFAFALAHPSAGARVLALADDAARSPLLIERDFDRGCVLLWTSGLDPSWSRLTDSPRTLIPLVHELVRYATRSRAPERNVGIGEPLVAELGSFARSLAWEQPSGARLPAEEQPEPIGPARWRVTRARGADEPGLWRLLPEGQAPIAFAVALGGEESDLTRLAPEALGNIDAALVPARAAARKDDGAAQQDAARGELWRALALACLLCVAAEALWAAWIGRSRR